MHVSSVLAIEARHAFTEVTHIRMFLIPVGLNTSRHIGVRVRQFAELWSNIFNQQK